LAQAVKQRPAEDRQNDVVYNHNKVRGDSPTNYRAMHFSVKRGIAIAFRLSVCDVGDL